MRRAVFLVLAVALGARCEDNKEKSVTTFVVQDAATLARGRLDDVMLRGDVLVHSGDGELTAKRSTVVGPSVEANVPFDRACVSVNADTPDDSSVEVFARVDLAGDARTEWLPLGVIARPVEERKVPRSAEPFTTHSAKVDVDTIVLPHAKGRALSVRLVLGRSTTKGESPRVRRVVVVAWPRGKRDPEPEGAKHPAWGKTLDVVERSQRVEDPKIAGRICSATSLGMVLAFHGFTKETVEVCHEVHDRKAQIYGNWALNVAYAGRLGLDAAITRMASFRPLEDEIAAGRPVVITHRWSAGELTGSPVSATDGHLIVVRGFTKEGDLVVNDPAADPRKDQPIQRVYKRAEIAKTWLERGDGVAYLLAKRGAAK